MVKHENEYIEFDDYVILRITSDKYGVYDFIIDNDDVERVKRYHWCLMYSKQKDYVGIYATATNKELGHLKLLHRFIFNAEKGLFVDHKDGNTLNMRKSNLRHCTNDENLKNRKKPVTNQSGVKGVYWDWHMPTPKWRAFLKYHDKTYHLGYYEDFDEAVKARRKAEILFQGEFSRDYADEYIKGIKANKKSNE